MFVDISVWSGAFATNLGILLRFPLEGRKDLVDLEGHMVTLSMYPDQISTPPGYKKWRMVMAPRFIKKSIQLFLEFFLLGWIARRAVGKSGGDNLAIYGKVSTVNTLNNYHFLSLFDEICAIDQN